jgi:hypothetical protein
MRIAGALAEIQTGHLPNIHKSEMKCGVGEGWRR